MATPTTPPTRAPDAKVAARDAVREVKSGPDATMGVPKWDRYMAGREAEDGGSFGTALTTHAKSPSWARFARETFSKMYGSGIEKELADEDRPMGSEWVQKLHESAEALPEYRALCERSRRDAWACGVAAGEALNVLAQTVKPPDTDPQKTQDQLDGMRDMLREAGATPSPQQLGRMARLQRTVRDQQEEHAQALQNLSAKSAAVRSALRGACMKAQNQIEEMDDAMAAMGAGEGSGVASRVSAPPQKVRSALLKNAKLRKIMRLAGRMKHAAIQKQRSKARPGFEELCDVKPGNELNRLVPSELVNLVDEDTEALLFRRLTENAALTYELRGKEQRSEGPILLAVDESGSMMGAPDEWAKSIAMALMEIAARQNRPFAYVHFDGRVTRVDEVPAPKTLKLETLEELCTYFTGGGTSIGVALAHCAGMLEKAQHERGDKPWKRADVVLITDGCSGDNAAQDAAIKRIRAQGGHLYSFFVNCSGGSDPCYTQADEKLHITGQDIASGDPSKLGTIFSI